MLRRLGMTPRSSRPEWTILAVGALVISLVLKPMKPSWLLISVILALGAGLAACGDDDPVKPVNHAPVIQSLTAFPTALGPGDSTLVTCLAVDADGDSLLYDWVTDARLVIKGNDPTDHELYDSRSNTHVFYHGASSAFDSAWVECNVHDSKAANAVRMVTILVNQ